MSKRRKTNKRNVVIWTVAIGAINSTKIVKLKRALYEIKLDNIELISGKLNSFILDTFLGRLVRLYYSGRVCFSK